MPKLFSVDIERDKDKITALICTEPWMPLKGLQSWDMFNEHIKTNEQNRTILVFLLLIFTEEEREKHQ